ncbi:MAG: hypothetical protein ACO3IB_07935, partial [Phycisphaerales bacterium]
FGILPVSQDEHALARASDAEAQLAGAADAEDRARRARGTIEELAEAIAALRSASVERALNLTSTLVGS